MSVYTITSKRPGGIPRGSHIVIVSLPARRPAFESACSKSVSVNLDPGKYEAIISTQNPYNSGEVELEHQEFLVDVTEEQYKKLAHMRPKLAKGRQTSDGARWSCGFVGCLEEFSSATSVILHEHEHFGVDPLNDEPTKVATAEVALTNYGKQRAADPAVRDRAAGRQGA